MNVANSFVRHKPPLCVVGGSLQSIKLGRSKEHLKEAATEENGTDIVDENAQRHLDE